MQAIRKFPLKSTADVRTFFNIYQQVEKLSNQLAARPDQTLSPPTLLLTAIVIMGTGI